MLSSDFSPILINLRVIFFVSTTDWLKHFSCLLLLLRYLIVVGLWKHPYLLILVVYLHTVSSVHIFNILFNLLDFCLEPFNEPFLVSCSFMLGIVYLSRLVFINVFWKLPNNLVYYICYLVSYTFCESTEHIDPFFSLLHYSFG